MPQKCSLENFAVKICGGQIDEPIASVDEIFVLKKLMKAIRNKKLIAFIDGKQVSSATWVQRKEIIVNIEDFERYVDWLLKTKEKEDPLTISYIRQSSRRQNSKKDPVKAFKQLLSVDTEFILNRALRDGELSIEDLSFLLGNENYWHEELDNLLNYTKLNLSLRDKWKELLGPQEGLPILKVEENRKIKLSAFKECIEKFYLDIPLPKSLFTKDGTLKTVEEKEPGEEPEAQGKSATPEKAEGEEGGQEPEKLSSEELKNKLKNLRQKLADKVKAKKIIPLNAKKIRDVLKLAKKSNSIEFIGDGGCFVSIKEGILSSVIFNSLDLSEEDNENLMVRQLKELVMISKKELGIIIEIKK